MPSEFPPRKRMPPPLLLALRAVPAAASICLHDGCLRGALRRYVPPPPGTLVDDGAALAATGYLLLQTTMSNSQSEVLAKLDQYKEAGGCPGGTLVLVGVTSTPGGRCLGLASRPSRPAPLTCSCRTGGRHQHPRGRHQLFHQHASHQLIWGHRQGPTPLLLCLPWGAALLLCPAHPCPAPSVAHPCPAPGGQSLPPCHAATCRRLLSACPAVTPTGRRLTAAAADALAGVAWPRQLLASDAIEVDSRIATIDQADADAISARVADPTLQEAFKQVGALVLGAVGACSGLRVSGLWGRCHSGEAA
jgi:hypothetical protein